MHNSHLMGYIPQACTCTHAPHTINSMSPCNQDFHWCKHTADSLLLDDSPLARRMSLHHGLIDLCDNHFTDRITLPWFQASSRFCLLLTSKHTASSLIETYRRRILQASVVQQERARGYSGSPACPAAESLRLWLDSRLVLRHSLDLR